MKQRIIPVLSTERDQYERWYRLGLEAMTAASTRLGNLQDQSTGQPINWLPQFTVQCSARRADNQVPALRRAIATLAVTPSRVTVTASAVRLTFDYQATKDAPVGNVTAETLWRLYDGLLNNLIGTAFQPVVGIEVGLTGFAAADQSSTRLVTPNFADYCLAPTSPVPLTLAVAPLAANQPASGGRGRVAPLKQLK